MDTPAKAAPASGSTGKILVIAALVVLSMGTAFVGGLIVAMKAMPAAKEPPAPKAITKQDLDTAAAKLEEAAAGHGAKGAAAPAEEKAETPPSVDELIKLVDYGIEESRNAGKALFRRKIQEDGKAVQKGIESEKDEAVQKANLQESINRWLERTAEDR